MHTQSFTARGTWVAISAALWIIAGIIAEGIPVFNDVLGLAVSIMVNIPAREISRAHGPARAPCLPAGFPLVFRGFSGFI